MGIPIEFNTALALRPFATKERLPPECIPQKHHLLEGMNHSFLKEGQRCYCLDEPIPLCITEGERKLSQPIAAIQIIEYKSYIASNKKIVTSGKYQIVEIFEPGDSSPHFNGITYIPSKHKLNYES